jgi:hypothetical protein
MVFAFFFLMSDATQGNTHGRRLATMQVLIMQKLSSACSGRTPHLAVNSR